MRRSRELTRADKSLRGGAIAKANAKDPRDVAERETIAIAPVMSQALAVVLAGLTVRTAPSPS
jgi:hypothetical protein